MSRGSFKGLVLLNARNFCEEHHGAAGWNRVRGALRPPDREIVDGAVHVGWYDLGLYDRLHETIDRVLGQGDNAIMVPLGYYCAERDLTTVHRLFARMATPAFLLSRYGDFWKRYQDTGKWTVVSEGPRRVRGTLTGWGSTSETTCVRLAAYIERFVQLVGGTGAHVSRPKCCSRGDRACEYLAEWRTGATTE